MKYIIPFLLVIVLSLPFYASAQELNCQVTINSEKIGLSDKAVFETLQKSVHEFLNGRQWTNIVLETDERIECSVFITVNSKAGDAYSATIQVQSRRPVYNSDYNSVLLNHKDNDFSFSYVQHDALEFQTNTFSSNLTSVLAYYAYVIIGYDFDTFKMNGGTVYFNEAQTIVNNAQNASESGWKAYESSDKKNRYWFVENMLNSAYQDYRTYLYNYHRLGLDIMYKEITKGRNQALTAVELLSKVHRNQPNLFVISLTMDAKRDEFVGLFTEAPMPERQRAKKVFMEIDPAQGEKYMKMLEGPK